jgi:hypothetical protein
MKPLLVICPGLMKSGTTSLYFHFYEQYLLHFGHGKEHYYLNNIYQNDYSCEDKFKNNFLTEKFYTFKENHTFKSFEPYYKERTLENYKNYFLEIYEYYVTTKNMFYGVADFSQSYQVLSLDHVKQFRDYITEYFNIKIVRMTRDPVRRFYSYCNMVYGKDDAKKYFYELLTDEKEYFYYSKINKNFIQNWNTSVWGTEHSDMFFYESMFKSDDQSELKRLHKFLGIPYLPIDSNRVEIKGNYREALTEEDIAFGREKLRKEYVFYYETLSYLPDQWEHAKGWNIDSAKYSNLDANYHINPIDCL